MAEVRILVEYRKKVWRPSQPFRRQLVDRYKIFSRTFHSDEFPKLTAGLDVWFSATPVLHEPLLVDLLTVTEPPGSGQLVKGWIKPENSDGFALVRDSLRVAKYRESRTRQLRGAYDKYNWD